MNNKYHFNRRNLIEKIESALSKKDSGKSFNKVAESIFFVSLHDIKMIAIKATIFFIKTSF